MGKVRFGVVGTNFITDWVIAGAREDERFQLSAVCSRTRERGEEFAAKHSIEHVFTSLEEMAASDKVDAIYIASPNYMHAEQSILCMNHGKHVLCEKPLAQTHEDIEAMRKALPRLLPFKIGSRGELLEWYKELKEHEPDHRHKSHLYGLHPGQLITPDETPDMKASGTAGT